MGLQEILDEIRKEAESEHEDIVTQAKIEADKLVVRKLDELTSAYDKKYESLDSEVARLKAKLRARAELEAERRRQRAETALLDGLINDSCADLIGLLRGDPAKYREFLVRLAGKALAHLPGDGEVGLSFRKDEEHFYRDIVGTVSRKTRLLEASRISGGLICVCGDIYIDYSFENLFRKLRPDLVRILAEYFKD